MRGACRVAVLAVVVGACQGGTEPQPVGSVGFEPDSVHLVPGETAQFTVQVFDDRSRSMPDRVDRVSVGTPSPSLIEMRLEGERVTVTALAAGAATITGQLGFGQGEAFAFVAPTRVASIDIEPDTLRGVSRLTGGDLLSATVHLYGPDGEEVSPEGHRISWASDGYNIPRAPGPGITFRLSGSRPNDIVTTLRVVVGTLTAEVPLIVIHE